MILWTTILNKLSKYVDNNTLRFECDIRYLDRWIREYPKCFPNYIHNNNYKTLFNHEKLRYELHRIS